MRCGLEVWDSYLFESVNSPVQLLSFLTCDGVHVDPITGKQTILGVFSNLRAAKFPAVHPRMIWFLSITDVPVGKHRLKVTMGLAIEEPKVIIDREFESRNPAHRLNLVNDIQKLKFDKPGDYTINIEIDEQSLLVTTFSIIQ